MSAIRYALERLDNAVCRLDDSVMNVENVLHECRQTPAHSEPPQFRDSQGNVVDVDFVAKRLDRAIGAVEYLLSDRG